MTDKIEIGIDEYEDLKMRLMDLEDENKSLKEENTACQEFSLKVARPFVKAGVSPEQFDDIMSNCEEVELVEIMQQPWEDPLTCHIGIKIKYRKRV